MLVELQERTSLSIVKMNNSSNDQYQCQTNEHNFLTYRYQSEAHNYQFQIKVDDPQPVYLHR